jgi:L-histidine N-alpha-methyltransferase
MKPTFATEFAQDVARDLARTPRQLQSKYLYDALGSQLFEAICRLPWYSITRAELSLLDRHAGQIVAPFPEPLTLTELGPGDGEKISLLARAAVASHRNLRTHLIDISPTALEQAERQLQAYAGVSVVGHRATYEVGLKRVAEVRNGDGPLLVLFLGSNLGNFDLPAAADFLRSIRSTLRSGDALLLGADLVKPEPELLAAYDDPLGVTAAFNKNLLVRINRELGGDFDLAAFTHRAVFDRKESRIEMHLVSLARQTVRIADADLAVTFDPGESIWTESSYKYSREALNALVSGAGFELLDQWIDPRAGFALGLYGAA